MGNSCSHRTVQEVTDDLLGDLLNSAKSTLKNDFGQYLPDGSSLQQYTEKIAESEFKNKFKYDWDSTATNCNPPNVDKKNRRVIPVSDFCIVKADQNLDTQIAEYVSDGVQGAGLQSWMSNQAIVDLSANIKKYFEYPTDNKWHYNGFNEQYDAPDTDADSYALDISLVYTNATKTESAVEVTLHIFYFVGVYYTCESPKAKTQAALRQSAYALAAGLPNVTGHVTDDPELQAALLQHFNPLFAQKWNYLWGGDQRPKDLASDVSKPTWDVADHLAYFQDNNLTNEQLDARVETFIMNGLNLSVPEVAADIKTDIKTAYQYALTHADSTDWNHYPLDKTYGLKYASVRPLRMNAFTVYYSAKKTIYSGGDPIEVDMFYIYFFCVVYEIQLDPISQDMDKLLAKNIPGVSASDIPDHLSPEQLTAMVEKWNRTEFVGNFGIDFPALPDTGKDHKVLYRKSFFKFTQWYPTVTDIQEKMTDQIFGPDDKKDHEIGKHLQQSVFDWLVKMFQDFSGDSYPKDPNEWYSHCKKDNFQYKSNDGKTIWDLDVKAAFAYANGTETEDGEHGAETIKYFYNHLLLYVTAEPEADSDSDVT